MTVPSTEGKTPYNEIIAKCNCELPSQVIHDVNVLLLEGIKIVASSAASKRVLFIGDSTVRGLFLSILRAASQNSQLSSPFQVWYRKCPRCGARSCRDCIDHSLGTSIESFVENFEWGHIVAEVAGLRLEFQYEVPSTICFKRELIRQHLRPHKRDVYAILFNYGLWFLHLWPAHDCLKFPPPQCSLFRETVKESALWLRHVSGNDTKLVWKTSNAICESKFEKEWAKISHQWHGTKEDQREMEMKCRDHCPFFTDERPCKREIFDGLSTEWQRNVSLTTLGDISQGWGKQNILVQDGWEMTRDRCDYTAVADGRHFATLDRVLALDFFARISDSHDFRIRAEREIKKALPNPRAAGTSDIKRPQ